MDRLYQLWCSGELHECELRAQISQEKPDRAVFFETYLIDGLRPSQAEIFEQGDRCMKDTHHPSVHRLVHAVGEPKC
jgi:hypothetical protein